MKGLVCALALVIGGLIGSASTAQAHDYRSTSRSYSSGRSFSKPVVVVRSSSFGHRHFGHSHRHFGHSHSFGYSRPFVGSYGFSSTYATPFVGSSYGYSSFGAPVLVIVGYDVYGRAIWGYR